MVFHNYYQMTQWRMLFYLTLQIYSSTIVSASCPTTAVNEDQLSNLACECQWGQVIKIRTLEDNQIRNARTIFYSQTGEFSLEFGRTDYNANKKDTPLNGRGASDYILTILPQNDIILIKTLSKKYPVINLATDMEAKFSILQGPVDVTIFTMDMLDAKFDEYCMKGSSTTSSRSGQNTYDSPSSTVEIVNGKTIKCREKTNQRLAICGSCNLPVSGRTSSKFLIRAIKINNERKPIIYDWKDKISNYNFRLNYYLVRMKIGVCQKNKPVTGYPWTPPPPNFTNIRSTTDFSYKRKSRTDHTISQTRSDSDQTTTENTLTDTTIVDKDADFLIKNRMCGIPPIYRRSRKPSGKVVQTKPNEFRIKGGRPAQPMAWPWQVAIFYDVTKFLCGGVIVRPNIILTAAHCFLNLQLASDVKKLRIRAGKHNLTVEKEMTQQTRRVERVIKHEGFNGANGEYKHDIAIIILRKPLKYNRNTIDICLDNGFFPIDQPKTSCYITGWGLDNVVLNQLKLPLVPTEICNKPKHLNNMVTDGMFCAGFFDGGKDACAGDSGGPLQCFDDKRQRWYLTGIVSWGQGCAQKNKVGVYTNVQYYLKWIQNNW